MLRVTRRDVGGQEFIASLGPSQTLDSLALSAPTSDPQGMWLNAVSTAKDQLANS